MSIRKSLKFFRVITSFLVLPLTLLPLGCGQDEETPSPLIDEATPSLALTSVLATLPAPHMPTRVGCGSDSQSPPGTYAQWCDGYIEQELTFPTAGVYQFDVTAFGSHASGVGPDLELRIDQQAVTKLNIAATSAQTYSFQVAVNGGKHRFALAFTNDAATPTDRNLYLEKTVVYANPTPLASLQASAIPTKVGCGEVQGDGFYGQLCQGYTEADLSIAQAGPIAIALGAYGSFAGGAWPKLEIMVDGTLVKTFDIASTTAQNYLVTTNLAAGVHKLRLAFNNDYWGGTRETDRNLYLGKLDFFQLGHRPSSGLKLVWSDEFSSPTLNRNYWNFEVNGDGGGNNELQYYTDWASNAYISNGDFVIQANKQNYNGKQYTSARVTTSRKFDFTYGRVDVRAKLPKGQGLWPAIWMMPTDSVYGGWPQSGEIDIMELVGHQPNVSVGSIHYGNLWPQNKYLNASYRLPTGDFSQNYHVFSVEWEPHMIKWYVDGQHFQTRKPEDLQTCANGQRCPWPFDRNFFVILNVAVGGNWPGSPDASTVFPQTMRVDYVRVYQK